MHEATCQWHLRPKQISPKVTIKYIIPCIPLHSIIFCVRPNCEETAEELDGLGLCLPEPLLACFSGENMTFMLCSAAETYVSDKYVIACVSVCHSLPWV